MTIQSLYFTVPSALLDGLTRYGVEELAQRLAINSSVSNTQIAFLHGNVSGVRISAPHMHHYEPYANSIIVDLVEQFGCNTASVGPLVLPPHLRWDTTSVNPDLTVSEIKQQLLGASQELEGIRVTAKLTLLLPPHPLAPQLMLETDTLVTADLCNNTHMRLKHSYLTGALKALLPPSLLFSSPIRWRGLFNQSEQQAAS